MAEKGGTEPPLTLAVHNRHSPDHFSISSTLTLHTTHATDMPVDTTINHTTTSNNTTTAVDMSCFFAADASHKLSLLLNRRNTTPQGRASDPSSTARQ